MISSTTERICILALAATLGLAFGFPAAAQNYPSRVVRIIVPYPAGGGPDLLARGIGDRLASSWGQPFVTDNRPGAGTLIGTQEVARATPDGHMILITDTASMTINPFIYKTLPYDPDRDFIPVTQLVRFFQVLLANLSLPANSLKEVIAHAKANPGKLSYGSYGIGTVAHLSAEQIKHNAGIDIVHIPYKGAESLVAAVRGEVHFAFAGGLGSRTFIGGGKLKGIAIGGPARSGLLPDVQTFAEQGYPMIDTSVSFGVFVRSGTPAPIVERIHRDFVAVLTSSEFQEKYLKPIAFEPVGSSPAEFAAFIKSSRENHRRLIENAGIRPE